MTPPRFRKAYGEFNERRIIDALRREPMTIFQIADMLGITRGGATFYMTRLRKQKRARVVSHIKNVTGMPLPVFGIGGEPDAVYIANKPRKQNLGDRKAKTIGAMLALLDKPRTAADLGERLGKSASIMRQYLRELRDEKRVRIADWKRTGSRNAWAPAYKVGNAKDKPMPERESYADYNRRRRADPDYRERESKQRQHRDMVKSLRKKPATWTTALGV